MRSGPLNTTGVLIAVFCSALAVSIGGAPVAAAAPGPDQAKLKKRGKLERLRELRRQNKKQKRPNVILISTDDQNQTDMFVMSITQALLGGRGTTFENSYVTYPLCCPSRATQITGQYAHNHGVTTTDLPNGYNGLDHSNTLAVWLRRAKYRTAMVGKYLNGYGINDNVPEPVSDAREIPPGWAEWYGLTGGTDQKRYNFKLNENGKVRRYGKGARNYVTDVLSSKVNELLKRWAVRPKPFFLYFNPTAPHGEQGTPFFSTRDPQPAPRHLGLLGDISAPRTPNFNEQNVNDKPQMIQDMPRLTDAQIMDVDRRYRGRLESLLAVDEAVKRIVGLVRKYGDKRKTFFIFTSDNGVQLGSHRMIFKDALYEESERVPLIIRGPGIPAGVTRSQLVSNIDLAPTILDITGAQPGRAQDGISLLPLVANPGAAANRDLLFEVFDFGIFGIRRGPWKLNQYENGGQPDEFELYNLNDDPYELTNEDGQPANATIKAELLARLTQLRTCVGASCR
jgi:N-acetylglucosamine-6-sulfatase